MEVLVIGLGSMGKRRIRLLKGFQQVTNIGGVDGREDRRNETTEKLNCNVCESIGEALKKHPKIICAFVCTSPLSHNTIIRECLQNWLHTFKEINLVQDGYSDNIKLAKSE